MQYFSEADINAAVFERYCTAGKIERLGYIKGVSEILAMLSGYPGDTWEERWLASGCDSAPRTWIAQHALLEYEHWSPARKRGELVPRPPKKIRYEIRYVTAEAAKGCQYLGVDAPMGESGPTRASTTVKEPR